MRTARSIVAKSFTGVSRPIATTRAREASERNAACWWLTSVPLRMTRTRWTGAPSARQMALAFSETLTMNAERHTASRLATAAQPVARVSPCLV